MTPEQRERFRKHKPYLALVEEVPDYVEECEECGNPWPCDIGVLWGALAAVRALCDLSEWLNAEAEFWYGEWAAGRYAPDMDNGWGLGERLSRKSAQLVRAALTGEAS